MKQPKDELKDEQLQRMREFDWQRIPKREYPHARVRALLKSGHAHVRLPEDFGLFGWGGDVA